MFLFFFFKKKRKQILQINSSLEIGYFSRLRNNFLWNSCSPQNFSPFQDLVSTRHHDHPGLGERRICFKQILLHQLVWFWRKTVCWSFVVWANHSIRPRAGAPDVDVRCLSGLHLQGEGIPIPGARTHAAPFPLRGFPADEIPDRGRLSPLSPEDAEFRQGADGPCPREPFPSPSWPWHLPTAVRAFWGDSDLPYLPAWKGHWHFSFSFLFLFIFYWIDVNRTVGNSWGIMHGASRDFENSNFQWDLIIFYWIYSLIPRRNQETKGRTVMEYHPATKWRLFQTTMDKPTSEIKSSGFRACLDPHSSSYIQLILALTDPDRTY